MLAVAKVGTWSSGQQVKAPVAVMPLPPLLQYTLAGANRQCGSTIQYSTD